MLERPVRMSSLLDRHRRVVIASGLAISVVAALVLIPRVVNPADAAAPVAKGSTTGFTPVPAGLNWRDAKNGGGQFVSCLGKPATACTLVRGTGLNVLLIGDSHAWMMIPAFTEIARRNNLTFSASVDGHCVWQRNLYVIPYVLNGVTASTQRCKALKDDTYARVVPELNPDVIVLMEVAHEHRGLTPYLGPDGRVLKNDSPASYRWIEATTTRSIAALRANGRKILIIEPIPVAPFDPLDCLSKAKVIEECRYLVNAAPDPIEQFFRQLARRDANVWSADFDRLVCPFLPICDPVVNGQIVKWDATHLTSRFAKSIAPRVDAYLKAAGLIPR
jgi:hypothetical protein